MRRRRIQIVRDFPQREAGAVTRVRVDIGQRGREGVDQRREAHVDGARVRDGRTAGRGGVLAQQLHERPAFDAQVHRRDADARFVCVDDHVAQRSVAEEEIGEREDHAALRCDGGLDCVFEKVTLDLEHRFIAAGVGMDAARERQAEREAAFRAALAHEPVKLFQDRLDALRIALQTIERDRNVVAIGHQPRDVPRLDQRSLRDCHEIVDALAPKPNDDPDLVQAGSLRSTNQNSF